MILGNLRYKIIITLPALTKNSFGEQETIYIDFISLKAQKKYVNQNKSIDAGEVFAGSQIEWTTHYRPQITTEMHVKYQNSNYRILAIEEIGFKEGLKIITELINE